MGTYLNICDGFVVTYHHPNLRHQSIYKILNLSYHDSDCTTNGIQCHDLGGNLLIVYTHHFSRMNIFCIPLL